MSSTTALASGTRFGKYTLVRQLAVGGMAEIYLARADGIGQFAKQVVLKRILPQYAGNEDFVEMFLHEARLAARLQHPNVVQVFDIGEADGSYFFTMEYVHGDDLRTLLGALRKRGEQLPIDHAVAIVTGAAAGLHHAHEQLDDTGRPLDMVHRDVSPSNIMLSFDGAVKVTDFGIAKTSSQVIQTRSGVLKGKIAYMSPEQCRSDPLDRRSDIFALGIVLHELVTGQKLFRADNDYAILRRIIEEDAPKLSAATTRDIPPELEGIVARALARDRDRRYPTAQALQADLEALARTHRLDMSSIALASYIRERVAPPSPAAPEAGTATPATTPIPAPPTQSTVIEPVSSTGTAAGEVGAGARPRSRVVGIGAAVAALGIATAAMVWRARDESSPPAPGPRRSTNTTTAPEPHGEAVAPARPAAPASPPVAAGTAAIDAGIPDAAGPAHVVAAPPDAAITKEPVRPRPRPRPRPATTTDPCGGWNPNSMTPPPPGCDPK